MSRLRYRSQTRQTLHYLARPHTHVPTEPIEHPACWSADQLAPDEWRYPLTGDEVAEIGHAVEVARARLAASNRSRGEMTADDLPLPTLARRVGTWRDLLAHGRGFVVVRGVPVDRWSQDDRETFFWGLGLHLGVPGAQNPQGDLLGHVRSQGFTDQTEVRAYRTNTRIRFHCDTADVVGLLCTSRAASGGRSRIASSVAVFNALVRERPDLAPLLFDPIALDTKAEGGVRYFPISPARFAHGDLRTFYHADYFRSAQRYPDAPALDARHAELFDAYDAIADRLCLTMDLAPGDIQLLNNHTHVHAREAYEDGDSPRHLLRLWLSLGTAGGWRRAWAWLRLVQRLARERVRQRAIA